MTGRNRTFFSPLVLIIWSDSESGERGSGSLAPYGLPFFEGDLWISAGHEKLLLKPYSSIFGLVLKSMLGCANAWYFHAFYFYFSQSQATEEGTSRTNWQCLLSHGV